MGIPGRYSHCWSISWKTNNTKPEIATRYLHAEVMKCNRSMKDCIMQARKVDDVCASVKPKQMSKQQYGQVHVLNTTSEKRKMNSKKNVTTTRKTSMFDLMLLPNFIEKAISHLATIPVTSPDDHSPVETPSIKYPSDEDLEECNESGEDNIDTNINPKSLATSNYNYTPKLSYNPDFMKMDDTYHQNIKACDLYLL